MVYPVDMALRVLYTLPMISLTVNGKPYSVDVAPEMPLLWVIRDVIGLTGTKFGCGLSQCGYCQSGQIMSAAALLAKTPKPTDAQIDTAMNGNICRCGTYQRIHRAIKRAAGVQA